MALTFTALAAANATTTNQSTAYTGNAGTPSVNDILVCLVMCSGNNTVGTLSGGGWTWNLLTSFTKLAGADIVSVWYAHVTTALTSTTPSYLPAAAATGCIISCVRVTGQEGINVPYVRQIAINNVGATTTNPTVTFANAPLTNNGILAFGLSNTSNNSRWTAPTAFTELSQVSYSIPNNAFQTVTRGSGQTAVTLTWTNSQNDQWATWAVEFYTSGTGPTAPNDSGFGNGFFGGINTL